MAADFSHLCSRTLNFQDDVVRNIRSIRLPQDLFDDLTEDAEAARVAITAELTLRVPSIEPAVTRPFDYGSVITYSFNSARWQETRYSDGSRYGVWYGSLDVRTTVYETAFHWHRFILDSFADLHAEVIGERRLFEVHCDGLLIDARGREIEEPLLTSRSSYALTQSLGRYLVDQQQNGILFKSARCDGTNIAVFNPARLANVRDKLQLTYRCVPAKDRIAIERLSGKTWFTIKPSTLGQHE